MILIGVVLAGLFLIVRPLPGLMRGMSTGVLIGKGYAKPRISREEDPERFKALMRQRMTEMAPGFLLLLGAVAWVVMDAIATASQPAFPG